MNVSLETLFPDHANHPLVGGVMLLSVALGFLIYPLVEARESG